MGVPCGQYGGSGPPWWRHEGAMAILRARNGHTMVHGSHHGRAMGTPWGHHGDTMATLWCMAPTMKGHGGAMGTPSCIGPTIDAHNGHTIVHSTHHGSSVGLPWRNERDWHPPWSGHVDAMDMRPIMETPQARHRYAMATPWHMVRTKEARRWRHGDTMVRWTRDGDAIDMPWPHNMVL